MVFLSYKTILDWIVLPASKGGYYPPFEYDYFFFYIYLLLKTYLKVSDPSNVEKYSLLPLGSSNMFSPVQFVAQTSLGCQ